MKHNVLAFVLQICESINRILILKIRLKQIKNCNLAKSIMN